MTGAEDFEAETKRRGEELKALATAKKVIVEATSGAADQSYGLAQTSLLQIAARSVAPNGLAAARFVRTLAEKQSSPVLAQLATRMAAAAHSRDPFAKIKGLIADMIEKLLKE